MKSLRFLFSAAIVLSVLILSSCGGDDPEPASVVGKWKITKAEPKITPSNQALISLLVSSGGMTQAEAQIFVNELLDAGAVSTTGTLEVKSDGKYEQTDDNGDKATGTWELSSDGKTLTIDKGTADQQVATVAKLDASNMELDFDYTGDIGLPSSTGLGYHVILTFERL